MIVIEGVKDIPVKDEMCRLTLYGEGGVIQHFEDKAVIVGNWKALEPHGRLIDADAFKAYLLEWLMKFVTHPNFLEAKKVTENFFRDIDEAPTVLEAENG